MNHNNERHGTWTVGCWYNHSDLSPIQAAHLDLEFRLEYERQERNYVERTLKESYPSKFVVVYSFLTIVIGITLIILQIVYFGSNGSRLNSGSGIWAGLIYVLAGLLASSIIQWRKQNLLNLTAIFHFFAIFISVPLIFLNLVCLSLYDEEWSFLNDGKMNQNMKFINKTMIVLAVVSIVLLITFLVVLNSYFRRSRLTEPIDLNNFSSQNNCNQNALL